MKKVLFTFAAAGVLLAGCAKDDNLAGTDADGLVTVHISGMIGNFGDTRTTTEAFTPDSIATDNPDQKLTLTSLEENPQATTRAAMATDVVYRVFCFQMDNATTETSGTCVAWKDIICGQEANATFELKPRKIYRFSAYSYNKADALPTRPNPVGVSMSSDLFKKIPVSTWDNTDQNATNDLIFAPLTNAYTPQVGQTPSAVSLTFYHLFSRLCLRGQGLMPTLITHYVHGASLPFTQYDPGGTPTTTPATAIMAKTSYIPTDALLDVTKSLSDISSAIVKNPGSPTRQMVLNYDNTTNGTVFLLPSSVGDPSFTVGFTQVSFGSTSITNFGGPLTCDASLATGKDYTLNFKITGIPRNVYWSTGNLLKTSWTFDSMTGPGDTFVWNDYWGGSQGDPCANVSPQGKWRTPTADELWALGQNYNSTLIKFLDTNNRGVWFGVPSSGPAPSDQAQFLFLTHTDGSSSNRSYWSATSYSATYAYYLVVGGNGGAIAGNTNRSSSYAVRCASSQP